MSDIPMPRRFFVSRLSAIGAALGLTSTLACAASGGAADSTSTAAARSSALPPDELETWLASFNAPHKCIYDCVAPGGGIDGILYARNLIISSQEKLATKDTDFSVIVSFRHFSTPFGYNDAMWQKYPALAEIMKFDDPTTKKRAMRNVPLHDEWNGFSDASLPGLAKHGVNFTVCGAATTFIAGALAGEKGDAKAVEAELFANLVPNTRMVPAGVVVLQRAQKGGFAYTFAG
ncbi:MAG: hypothetical protein ABI120_24825 [Gemmatimonadaceae bacterium]